jgi:hypothetical protein
MIEVRVSPDGWLAQLMPADVISSEQVAKGRRWLCMTWIESGLGAHLLTDANVADWRVIYRDEATPKNPQKIVEMTSTSKE